MYSKLTYCWKVLSFPLFQNTPFWKTCWNYCSVFCFFISQKFFCKLSKLVSSFQFIYYWFTKLFYYRAFNFCYFLCPYRCMSIKYRGKEFRWIQIVFYSFNIKFLLVVAFQSMNEKSKSISLWWSPMLVSIILSFRKLCKFASMEPRDILCFTLKQYFASDNVC